MREALPIPVAVLRSGDRSKVTRSSDTRCGGARAFIDCTAAGIARTRFVSSDIVSSAAADVFPPGVFITITPRRVAAAESMLSTPAPARPICGEHREGGGIKHDDKRHTPGLTIFSFEPALMICTAASVSLCCGLGGRLAPTYILSDLHSRSHNKAVICANLLEQSVERGE